MPFPFTENQRRKEVFFRVFLFIVFVFLVFFLIPVVIFGAYLIINQFSFFVLIYFVIGFYGFLSAGKFIRNQSSCNLKWFSQLIKRLKFEDRLELYSVVAVAGIIFFVILTGAYTSLDGFFHPPKIPYHPLIPFVAVLPIYLVQSILFPVGIFVKTVLGMPWLEFIFNLIPIVLEILSVYFIGRTLSKAVKSLRLHLSSNSKTSNSK